MSKNKKIKEKKSIATTVLWSNYRQRLPFPQTEQLMMRFIYLVGENKDGFYCDVTTH